MAPNSGSTDRRFIRYALLLAGLFVAVRAIFYNQLVHSPVVDFPTLDSEFYYFWADRLAGGHGQPPGPFWLSPLYPMFMSWIFMGLGTHAISVVVIAQFVLSLATMGIVVYYTYRLFGAPAALAAGALAALYGPWVYYDGVMLSASLILFLNALLLLLLITRSGLVLEEDAPEPAAKPGMDALVWVGLGILTGLSALARPSILIFGAVLIAVLVLKKHMPFYRRAAIYVAAMALVLIPVLVRNYKVSGSLILTTSSGGVNFFIGNHAGASGMYDEVPWINSFDPQREAEGYRMEAGRLLGHEVSLNEASRYWGSRAFGEIVRDPAGWLRLMFRKLWLTVQREEIANNLSFRGVAGFTPILGALPVRWGLLFPLAVTGAFLAWRKRRDLKMLWLYGASYIVVSLIFFSASEYRFPLLLILLPAAGCFFIEMWHTVVGKDYRRLVMACGLYVVSLVVCNAPSRFVGHAVKPFADYYNMATVAVDRGMWVDAIPLYARSLTSSPDFREARIGLANALWKLGNFDDARQEFALAGVAAPDSVSGSPLQGFLDEVYQFTEDNDYQSALALMDSTFPVDKDAPATVWINRAMIESGLNHPAKAVEAILKASAKDPISPQYPYKAGVLTLQMGDSARADSFFEAAIERYPAYAPARIALGYGALARKDSAQARLQLDELRHIRIPEDSIRTQVWRLAVNLGEEYDQKP
ncbi:MAG TPA: tetratricopeptide repeat protein [bacterium]|jgi:4-amino-4-deoxy-L-arabinose transferase-like glycosyltransferase